MKPRTFLRHLKESFKSLRRNGWMTFASISAVTITLLLVGVFLVIMMNMNKFATDLENDVEIRVHIDLSATKQDQNELRREIENMSLVDSIEFSSKEEELEHLIETMGRDWALFEDQENPLRDVFIVKAKEPTDTPSLASGIRQKDYVYSAEYGEKRVENLFKVLRTSRNVGIVLIAGLLFTAMFLISNTIKITIFARRREIEIMKLVGATNWFIRWPFLFEGIWLGIIGSILPIGVVVTAYHYVYELMNQRMPIEIIKPLEFNPFVYQVSLLLLLIGIVIGSWGSLVSVRRFLKV